MAGLGETPEKLVPDDDRMNSGAYAYLPLLTDTFFAYSRFGTRAPGCGPAQSGRMG